MGKFLSFFNNIQQEPNLNSELLKKSVQVYKRIFNEDVDVTATHWCHGGLETGVILDKYPGTDIIAIGSTTKGAHSITEMTEIDSIPHTQKFIDSLLEELSK